MDGARKPPHPLAAVLAGQGAASACSFITILALGRFGGEAELGLFALGWSCWFLVMSLGDTLVATPYTYFASQRRPLCEDLVMTSAWGIVMLCGAVFLLLGALRLQGTDGPGALWPALPAAVIAASVREFARRHLMATARQGQLLRVDVAGAVVQLGGVAGLAAAGLLSAVNAFWVIAVAASVVVLPWCTRARLLRLLSARRMAVRVITVLFGYGRWLLLGGVCHVVSGQAYPWLAFAAGGQRLAGLFAACNSLLNLLSPLLTGLTNHFRPQFMLAQSRLSGPEFVGYVRRRLAIFVLPALALGVALGWGGEWALAHLYGPAFRAAAVALPWMSLGLLAVAFAAPLQLALLALHAPVTNLLYHGSALLWLGLAMLAAQQQASMAVLGQVYGAVNVAATLMLALLFMARCGLRQRAV